MIGRVVYVVESPLSIRDYLRFGVGEWTTTGIAVEVWEVDALFLRREQAPDVERPEACDIRRFSSMKELTAACRRLEADALVIMLSGVYVGEFASHRPMLVAIMKTQAVFTTVSAGQRPLSLPPEDRRGATRSLARLGFVARSLRTHEASLADLTRKGIQRLRAAELVLMWRLTRKGVRPLDWIWAGTDTLSINPDLIGDRTRVRYIHTWDYDRILTRPPETQGIHRGPVYLDAMGPLHPDVEALSMPIEVGDKQWFALVNEALTEIEHRLGEPVVIAAHPRAPRGLLESRYSGRDVRYGQTAALVASASVVLATDPSTSLAFAAIFDRPATVIRIPPFWWGHWLELQEYVDKLGLEVLDCRSIPKDWEPREVDRDAYASFMSRYVKRPGTPDSSFWEVVRQDLSLTSPIHKSIEVSPR